jgi:hypothetical protein
VSDEYKAKVSVKELVAKIGEPGSGPLSFSSPEQAAEAASKALLDHFTTGDTRQPTISVRKAVKGYTACPNCSSPDIRLVDGCPACQNCGWGKCA